MTKTGQTQVKSPGSEKYWTRARALADAIDIAIEVRAKAGGDGFDQNMTAFELDTKRMALNPEPASAKLASLKFLESAFLTYWNETVDDFVQTFWDEIAARGLPFSRRDPVRAALARGRITNEVDAELIADAVSDERFDVDERRRLDALLEAYGRRRARASARPARPPS